MILVLGSINTDLFFTVDRLPTRGETVLAPTADLWPGGKGANQAAAAARAGADTRFYGCVGRDGFAEFAIRGLAETGCDVSGIREVEATTGLAAIMVEGSGENQIVVGSGANGLVGADQLPAGLLGPDATLVCQMEIPADATAAALAAARAAGARTVLNLAPARKIDPAALASVDLLVVNEIEAKSLAADAADPPTAGRALAERHGLTCVLTLGGDGALTVGPGGAAWRIGALPVAAVDTVGAGDAFVGVLAAAVDRGLGLPEALRWASVAAGLACTRPGAMPSMPDRSEIEARLGDLAPARQL